MPKTIIEGVRDRQKQLKKDPVLASQNMALAMAAMRDGIRSDAWQQYMSQFVEQNPPGKPVDPDHPAELILCGHRPGSSPSTNAWPDTVFNRSRNRASRSTVNATAALDGGYSR